LDSTLLETWFQLFSWKFKNATSGRTYNSYFGGTHVDFHATAFQVLSLWGVSEKRLLLYMFLVYLKVVFIVSIAILGVSFFNDFSMLS
jgi:hypothetical protein